VRLFKNVRNPSSLCARVCARKCTRTVLGMGVPGDVAGPETERILLVSRARVKAGMAGRCWPVTADWFA
jgi:hypothetical protein